MLEQRGFLLGDGRLEEGVALALPQHGSLEKRDLLVEHARVARDVDIMPHDVRKPYPIVGNARADAAAGLGQPPMLNVALDELPRCGPQNVFARDVWHDRAERA